MLPFEHDLVKKVRQRSTSYSSKILMWRISLKSYNMMHAIAEEILSKFKSSKRSHKGQHQIHPRC